MCSDKIISRIIFKLQQSKFDDKLVDEISRSSMMMTFFQNNYKDVKNEKYLILLKDMINSFLKMQRKYENIVYTNPFEIFNFSWMYKNVDRNSTLGSYFCRNINKLSKSKFILSNEFPIELKVSLIINIHSMDYLKQNYNRWYTFELNSTEQVIEKELYLTPETLRNLLIYNHYFIDFSPKQKFDKFGTYLLLKRDYLSLIILAILVDDEYLTKLVKLIDNNELSISELFGKGLIIQTNEKEAY